MWTSLSSGRWTCLLTLTVVMLFSASEGHPMLIQLPCCQGGQMKKVPGIQQCFEQESRNDCPHHYYVVQPSGGPGICVKPSAPWLRQQLSVGDLTCESILSYDGRFEVLDKYDMEWDK